MGGCRGRRGLQLEARQDHPKGQAQQANGELKSIAYALGMAGWRLSTAVGIDFMKAFTVAGPYRLEPGVGDLCTLMSSLYEITHNTFYVYNHQPVRKTMNSVQNIEHGSNPCANRSKLTPGMHRARREPGAPCPSDTSPEREETTRTSTLVLQCPRGVKAGPSHKAPAL